MKIAYISFLLFTYVSFMLSRLFNTLSARHFWKNQIFAVKKLLQALNYCKIAIIKLRIAIEQMSYSSIFLLLSYLPNQKGCHLKKIIKGPGTSFHFLTLSQRHVRNVCNAAHQHLNIFHFDSTKDSKEISISVTSITQQCL